MAVSDIPVPQAGVSAVGVEVLPQAVAAESPELQRLVLHHRRYRMRIPPSLALRSLYRLPWKRGFVRFPELLRRTRYKTPRRPRYQHRTAYIFLP